jgi:hypothetical protein
MGREMSMKRIVLVIGMMASIAAGGIVFDAGEAMKANVKSGVSANPYTDAEGGAWSYWTSTAMTNGVETAMAGGVTLDGDAALMGFGDKGTPYLIVNTADHAIHEPVDMGYGTESLEPTELMGHPGNTGSNYVMLRFTVPHDGWYSSLSRFRDLNIGGEYTTRGVEAIVSINGQLQTKSIVSLEEWYDGTTGMFDVQTPVRYMKAGETFEFTIGPNGFYGFDATGIKATIREEDEGMFFDAGSALEVNIQNAYTNPCGDVANGTWSYYRANSPTNPSLALLSGQNTRDSGTVGFMDAVSLYPFVVVNAATTNENESPSIAPSWYTLAPNELMAHPYNYDAATPSYLVLRFQPTVSGFYSASAVFRDVCYGGNNGNGVDVHLVIGGTEITNVVVSSEAKKQTAHLVMSPRLLVAGEPVDIFLGPNGWYGYDTTAISAIIRRETDGFPAVWDAGHDLRLSLTNGTPANPYAVPNGATWAYGSKGDVFGTFTPFTTAEQQCYTIFGGWSFGAGTLPRAFVNIAGSALTSYYDDSMGGGHLVDGIFPLLPDELSLHPNPPGDAATYCTVRLIVPSDGLYQVRVRAHDISLGGGTDGVKVWLTANGNVLAAPLVSIDTDVTRDGPVFSSGTLWMKAGETVDVTVDPRAWHGWDSTAVGFCAVREDGVAGGSVINVDFDDPNNGKVLGAFTGAGRIGFSDQTAWNALELTGAVAAATRDLYEADGKSRRNVRVSVARADGALVGTSGAMLLDSWIQAADTNDVCTFTVTGLVPCEAYTLCLYSYAGTAAGDALFTVNGETKGVSDEWFLTGAPVCTQFTGVPADEDGVIVGTFTSGSATNGPAAFNGLQILGEFPAYISPGTILRVR